MDASNLIAVVALAVSLFTFYWTSIRIKKSLYLVRIDSLATRMEPEFAIINGGNTDILITSTLCAFESADSTGWDCPEDQQFIRGEMSLSIPAGKSCHMKVYFPSQFSEDFVKEGVINEKATPNLFHRNMLVIVEWVDSHGNEYRAEAKIANYGFNLNGNISMSRPLEKWHDLYKIGISTR